MIVSLLDWQPQWFDEAVLMVRLAFGASLFVHGFRKLGGGVGAFSDQFDLPRFVGGLVVGGQMTCGVFIAVGLAFSWMCMAAAVIAFGGMLMMALRMHTPFIDRGRVGWDYPMMHTLLPLVLMVVGPGAYAAQRLLAW